jgi:hypothetical protein
MVRHHHPTPPNRLVYRPVYKALHQPLTICGVDRRLFVLAMLLGASTFNLSTPVFTMDRTDSSLYRVKGRKPFRIVPSD